MLLESMKTTRGPAQIVDFCIMHEIVCSCKEIFTVGESPPFSIAHAQISRGLREREGEMEVVSRSPDEIWPS